MTLLKKDEDNCENHFRYLRGHESQVKSIVKSRGWDDMNWTPIFLRVIVSDVLKLVSSRNGHPYFPLDQHFYHSFSLILFQNRTECITKNLGL